MGKAARISFFATGGGYHQIVAGLFGFPPQHAAAQPHGWVKEQCRRNQPMQQQHEVVAAAHVRHLVHENQGQFFRAKLVHEVGGEDDERSKDAQRHRRSN